MGWSYSGDPAESDLDAVRFYVQDTNEDDQLISDEEIEFLLAQWMPVYESTLMVAAQAAETISGKFAREVSYSADGVSVGAQELQGKYDALASSLRDQHKQMLTGGGPYVGGILWSENPDPMVKPSVFATGMHDNISAGQQDYGSDTPLNVPEIDGSP